MLVCDAGRCTVQGPLTMSNVTAVLEQSRALFKGPQIVVDLAGVTEVDSAALSLLLEWRRLAAAEKRAVEYRNLPANLRTLADLYGVSGLLPAS
ncbi:MAG: anti-sigma-factor antagonist [Betaproteobacteria bacterium]|jgi:phospholipid transport system transporter-binding protein|nr:anti-sigma-factor antagonist [Betaproteobacteria bacterium]